MSACSPKEELEWRNRLVDRSSRDAPGSGEQAILKSLSLAIKPLGIVFGKPGEYLIHMCTGSAFRGANDM
jgi:hypothetical protein